MARITPHSHPGTVVGGAILVSALVGLVLAVLATTLLTWGYGWPGFLAVGWRISFVAIVPAAAFGALVGLMLVLLDSGPRR